MDELSILSGEDYVINDQITIRQPTLGEIRKTSEQEYWSIIAAFTLIPSDIKAPLWDSGVDWEKISDFELFMSLVQTVTPQQSSLLFGDIDFRLFRPVMSPETGDVVLFNSTQNILIDVPTHHRIVEFLCLTHGIKKKIEFAANERTKQILIDINREDLEDAKKNKSQSQFRSLISAMVMYPGFKYNYHTVLDITYFQLLDAIQRAQIYTSSMALLQGGYSGMCDLSKVDKDKFNWLRESM